MATVATITTRISSEGQVFLPSSVRLGRHWDTGTELIVEEIADGVLLRAAPLFPPTTVDEVFGMLKYDGPPVTLEEMDAAVLAEAARRDARSRY